MKKTAIALAMATVLGVAGTAMAANPFTDVPANHWSYASVSKLAQAGIIEGYGDGTFRGNNSITRYEMAQMVAKAMARSDKADAAQKAMIEKLAAEYSAELNNLGVRVSALEKKTDNVKITGQARMRYQDFDADSSDNNSSNAQLRTRLWLTSTVNDDWKFVNMIEDIQDLKDNGTADTDVFMARAYADGKVGDVAIKAGRFDYKPVWGAAFDDDMDGLLVGFGKDLKVNVFAGRMAVNTKGGYDADKTDAYGAELAYNFGNSKKWAAKAGYYYVEKTADASANNDVYEAGVSYKFDKNWAALAQYIGSSEDFDDTGKDGYYGKVFYKGMNLAKKGSWGAYASAYDIPTGAGLNTTFDLDTFGDSGIKGYEVGFDYAMLKNVQLHVAYADGENQLGVDKSMAYTYVAMYF